MIGMTFGFKLPSRRNCPAFPAHHVRERRLIISSVEAIVKSIDRV